ncbi:Zinc-finger domain of monoamine-oxidase A repressor R1 [Sesbania bispinosa]|nr:Zinc-finger domain of monoamine-oxidase A repressor R1 [Sesbania bispinosa]
MEALPSISTTNMEPEFSSQQPNGNEVDSSTQKAKSNNTLTVEVIENRIYGSSSGKTCHQNMRNGKPCVLKFCHKCLWNRYGEMTNEVAVLSNWKCPKCRGICNCSCCRKKQGQQPTGKLAHTAKASGFKSVSEMLNATGNLESTMVNNDGVFPTKETTTEKGQKCVDDNVLTSKVVLPIASEKEVVVIPSREAGMENSLDGNGEANVFPTVCEKESEVNKNHDLVYGVKGGLEDWATNDVFLDPMTLASEIHQKNVNNTDIKGDGGNVDGKSQTNKENSLKVKKCSADSKREKIQEEIPLPPGIELTKILDIDFPPEDVGNALQFLEFCRVFGKPLDVNKGEAEEILRELVCKQHLRHGQNTLVIKFQLKLLTMILIDSGDESPSLTTTNRNNSWLEALEDLITESNLVLRDFPLDWLNEGIDGYYDLESSKKLALLNFICDKALSTKKLRSYVDDQNSKNNEERKEAKLKVATTKEKEKRLKQKLRVEMDKAIMPNEASFSISEHNELISKIKSEATQAHTELLEANGTISKRKQTTDAMRIKPELLDSSGHAFWKFKSYDDDHVVLLQDIKVQDAATSTIDERWFFYGPEKKGEIDKYISSR